MPSDHLQPRGLAMPDPVPEARGGGQRRSGPIDYLIDALRLRPAGRRTFSTLSVLLFFAGAGMFAYPLATDVYAERVIQERVVEHFETPELREAYVTRTVEVGDPLTRIVMPDIAVEAVVVEGTSPSALRAGAGHYPNTPLPGEEGNVAIAGHRTTYGKPFNRMDELEIGDEIQLQTPLATHIYRVVPAPADVPAPCDNGACWITHPTDWGVVSPLDGHFLTLTSCHPKGSARERIILRAELVNTIEQLPDGGAVVDD